MVGFELRTLGTEDQYSTTTSTATALRSMKTMQRQIFGWYLRKDEYGLGLELKTLVAKSNTLPLKLL